MKKVENLIDLFSQIKYMSVFPNPRYLIKDDKIIGIRFDTEYKHNYDTLAYIYETEKGFDINIKMTCHVVDHKPFFDKEIEVHEKHLKELYREVLAKLPEEYDEGAHDINSTDELYSFMANHHFGNVELIDYKGQCMVRVRDYSELAYRECRYYFWIEPNKNLPVKNKLHHHIQFVFKRSKPKPKTVEYHRKKFMKDFINGLLIEVDRYIK